MDRLVDLARWSCLTFLIALAAIIFYKILTGSISLDGLLSGDRKDGATYFSLGRTQLLIFTLVVAIRYIKEVILNPSTSSLPDISATTLGVLGGSQLFYLAGKAHALLSGPSAITSNKGKNQ